MSGKRPSTGHARTLHRKWPSVTSALPFTQDQRFPLPRLATHSVDSNETGAVALSPIQEAARRERSRLSCDNGTLQPPSFCDIHVVFTLYANEDIGWISRQGTTEKPFPWGRVLWSRFRAVEQRDGTRRHALEVGLGTIQCYPLGAVRHALVEQ